MPTVTFYREGVQLEVEAGSNLREAAQAAGVELYRSWHRRLNCRGQGKCGSCRIEISEPDAVTPTERTASEHRKLDRRFSDEATRLACQVCVVADTSVCTQPLRGRKRVETRAFIPRSF